MTSFWWKVLVVFLVFCGEALSVYAELVGASRFEAHGMEFWSIFLRMFGVITVAGACLIAGYILGFQAFKNIWIVSATSLTSILIVEPFLSYSIFHQLPTRGALIAMVLGIIGLVVVLTDSSA